MINKKVKIAKAINIYLLSLPAYLLFKIYKNYIKYNVSLIFIKFINVIYVSK